MLVECHHAALILMLFLPKNEWKKENSNIDYFFFRVTLEARDPMETW